MDGFSSAAAILQVIGNALNGAIQTARFVNSIRNAEKFQNDFLHGLELSQNTASLMIKQLASRDGDLENCYDKAFHETKEIHHLVRQIAKDCDKCNNSLIQLYGSRNNTIVGRVTGEFKLEMRRPEIESVNARFRTNVGNIQTLLSVLQLIASNSQASRTEQMDVCLQDIHARVCSLQGLQAEFKTALQSFNRKLKDAKTTEDPGSNYYPVCNDMALGQDDASACLRITEGTLRTASLIYERVSRGGSVQSLSSPASEIAAQSICDPTSVTTHNTPVPLQTMTRFLGNYIQEIKTEFAKGAYEQSKKYIQEALKWGECRYWEYKVDFYEWFDLQFRLVEIYEKEGNFQDAQNYITFLWKSSSSAADTLDYRRITEIQEVQLHCATARLCLRAHEQGDITILDTLKQEALAAYGAAMRAFRYAFIYDDDDEKGSDITLQQLLVESAETLDKVYELFDDPVGRKSLRMEHSILREHLPALDSIQQSSLVDTLKHQERNSPPGLVLIPSLSTSGSSETHSLLAVSTPITASSSRGSSDEHSDERSRGFINALCEDAFGTEETNDTGQTILLTAAKNNDFQLLKTICREDFATLNINTVDDTGMNALHHALTTMGGEKIVKLLIAKGIDVNANDNRNGDTPLHYCVRRDNLKAAELLLRTNNVVIENVNKSNQTAAQLALNRGMLNPVMLKLLIRYKANFDWPGLPRHIQNNLRKLGYASFDSKGSLEAPAAAAAVTDRTTRSQREQHRDSRSSQSSRSSQQSRWTQVIATISRDNP